MILCKTSDQYLTSMIVESKSINGLKVGSCPESDKSVQLFFVLFCVAFKLFYFLNLLLPRKLQDFAENTPFFVYLYPLCWNSNSKNSFVTCP